MTATESALKWTNINQSSWTNLILWSTFPSWEDHQFLNTRTYTIEQQSSLTHRDKWERDPIRNVKRDCSGNCKFSVKLHLTPEALWLSTPIIPMNYFLNDPALNTIQNTEQFTAIVEQATLRHEAFAERFGLESESLLDLTLNQWPLRVALIFCYSQLAEVLTVSIG